MKVIECIIYEKNNIFWATAVDQKYFGGLQNYKVNLISFGNSPSEKSRTLFIIRQQIAKTLTRNFYQKT